MAQSLRGLDDIIARERLLGRKADGSSIAITVEIGRPFPWGDISITEWACAFRIDPFYTGDAHGEGSLQALNLALQMVRSQLNHFEEEGGVLMYETGEKFLLTMHWPLQPY